MPGQFVQDSLNDRYLTDDAFQHLVLPTARHAQAASRRHYLPNNVLRVDDEDTRRRHGDVVDVGRSAWDATVVNGDDPVSTKAVEHPTDSAFACGAHAPRIDVLRPTEQIDNRNRSADGSPDRGARVQALAEIAADDRTDDGDGEDCPPVGM